MATAARRLSRETSKVETILQLVVFIRHPQDTHSFFLAQIPSFPPCGLIGIMDEAPMGSEVRSHHVELIIMETPNY